MAYSESHMAQYWRKAVHEKWHHRCALCGTYGSLQAHHIIRRALLLTRWDHRNGILLCEACHRAAHDVPSAREKVLSMVDVDTLSAFANQTSAQYFAKHTISKGEYYKMQLEENKRIAEGV